MSDLDNWPGAKITQVNPAFRELADAMKGNPPGKRQRGRSHKYGAEPTEVDGIKFPSKREASRWSELKILAERGEIRNLRRQVGFDLVVGGTLICRYVCDFEYTDAEGNVVTEDAKGVRTPEYELKKKLMRAIHGIAISEI